MTLEIAAVFALLALAGWALLKEWATPEVVAVVLFAALTVPGLAPWEEARLVFANPAPLTVGAIFILGAALEATGMVERLALALERWRNPNYAGVIILLVLIVGSFSAFLVNTPLVVVFTPVAVTLARRLDIPVSQLLIPLSFASIFGGTCTLAGQSTTLVLSDLAPELGGRTFTMFELARVGVPALLAGTLIMALFGRRLLPARETLASLLGEAERTEYLLEVYVPEGSEFVGRTTAEVGLLKTRGVRLLEVVRTDAPYPADAFRDRLQAGDRLRLACRPSGLVEARAARGVELPEGLRQGLREIAHQEAMLAEVVVAPQSDLIGRTLSEVRFRDRYRAHVVAVHRRGENLRSQLESVRLQFGDTLLLLVSPEALEAIRRGRNLLTLDRPPVRAADPGRRSAWVLGTLLGVFGLPVFGILPLPVSALTGCAVLFVAQVLKPKEAFRAVQWDILFLIYGMLAAGVALRETGGAAWLASGLESGIAFLPEGMRAWVVLAAVYAGAAVLTELITNQGAAVVVAQIAAALAVAFQINITPLLLAVAVAVSASFITPIGAQSNTYVYGVGGYRYTDFWRLGWPIQLAYAVITLTLVPIFWPLSG